MTGAQLMAEHLAPRGVLSDTDCDPSEARIAKAERDPMFGRKVGKAIAQLRLMRSTRHHRFASDLADAVEFAEATGATLPAVLESKGLLRRIIG